MPTISSKPPAPSPIAKPSAAPSPAKVHTPPPPPPPTFNTGTSSFQSASSSRPPVVLDPAPATTLRTERLGDGQANCLERANQLARPGDTVVLLADRRDASGHAVVQHPDGSVTDPNQPGTRYPSLAAWQSAHPQYHQPQGIPQQSLSQVLRTPPGPQRDALIRELGLTAIASRAVADPATYVTPDDGMLRLRSGPGTEFDPPLAEIQPGQILEVTGPTDADGWAAVSFLPPGADEPITGYAHIEDFTAPVDAEDAELRVRAQEVYIHQTDAEQQVTFVPEGDTEAVAGNGANANCGPTSLVNAFRLEGLELPDIPGITHNGTDGADVQAARFAMYGTYEGASEPQNDSEAANWAGRDGVVEVPDPDGGPSTYQYADMNLTHDQGGENSQYTGFGGIHRAVAAAGGYSEDVLPQAGETMNDAILRELEAGRTVIVSGDFTTDVMRPRVAPNGTPPERINPDGHLLDRNGNVVMERTPKTDTWARGGGATQHVVTVVGSVGSSEDGTLRFLINDPIHPSHGPVLVTPEELASYMNASNAGAVAIGGADDPALQQPQATGS